MAMRLGIFGTGKRLKLWFLRVLSEFYLSIGNRYNYFSIQREIFDMTYQDFLDLRNSTIIEVMLFEVTTTRDSYLQKGDKLVWIFNFFYSYRIKASVLIGDYAILKLLGYGQITYNVLNMNQGDRSTYMKSVPFYTSEGKPLDIAEKSEVGVK